MSTAKRKTAAKKSAPAKNASAKKSAPAKKASTKKKAPAKIAPAKKSSAKKNKLGVKNSLVNNINAHKKKGDSKSKDKSNVSKKSYREMENNWGEKK